MKRAMLAGAAVAAATVRGLLALQPGLLPFGHSAMTPAVAQEAAATKPRSIKYYRNPMGLPDTSPTPKKDSMGMDYIAVYDDEDTDDGTVSISLGKLQKTGVRSEQVERRTLNMPVRAPGTIEQDERRVSDRFVPVRGLYRIRRKCHDRSACSQGPASDAGLRPGRGERRGGIYFGVGSKRRPAELPARASRARDGGWKIRHARNR